MRAAEPRVVLGEPMSTSTQERAADGITAEPEGSLYARARAYLRQYPALQSDADALLDLIYNEVFLREQAGDRPRLEEYRQRFPHLAAELQIQFEVHRAIARHHGVPVP